MKCHDCFSSAGRMYAARVENLRRLEEEEQARGTRHSVQNSTAMFRLVPVNMMNIIAMMRWNWGRRETGSASRMVERV